MEYAARNFILGFCSRFSCIYVRPTLAPIEKLFHAACRQTTYASMGQCSTALRSHGG